MEFSIYIYIAESEGNESARTDDTVIIANRVLCRRQHGVEQRPH